jgi:hypothetical protein
MYATSIPSQNSPTSPMRSAFAPATYAVRSEAPLSEDEMRRAAPSVFAMAKHRSRSDRYTHVPTIEVLRELRTEGFEPFMVAQNRSRTASKTEFAKHLIRMRHASRDAGLEEVDEIILINSHDGASPYHMLAGVFRFACRNGLVVGSADHGVRIVHKGNILHDVIESAFRVLQGFGAVDEAIAGMKTVHRNCCSNPDARKMPAPVSGRRFNGSRKIWCAAASPGAGRAEDVCRPAASAASITASI